MPSPAAMNPMPALELVPSRRAARFRVGSKVVDLDTHMVGDTDLTEQEAAILRVLWEADARAVSKETLYREVWGYTRMPRGRALDFAVHRIRQKLGKDGEQGIATVRGVGFRMDAEAAPPSEPAPPGLVAAPPLAEAPPAVTSQVSTLRSMRPLTSFVGTRAALDELAARMSSGDRCITLLGPPGIGKTRLAVETLLTVEQPVYVADLSSLPSRTDPLHQLATALGATRPIHKLDAVVALAAGLGPGILFLDRCEHVAEGLAAPVEAILRGSTLTVVATSRHLLNISGERIFDVLPMSVEDGCKLLVERGRAVRRRLRLEPSEPVAQRLVAALAAIPLAIELTASRMRTMAPAQLEKRLAESAASGDTETTGSLSDAIAWSWSLLAPEQQQALVKLTLLGDRFEGALAAVVLGGDADAAEWVIESLMDRSWLQPAEGNDGLSVVFLKPLRSWVVAHTGGAPTIAMQALTDHLLRLAQTDWSGSQSVGSDLNTFRRLVDHALDSGHPKVGPLAAYILRLARSRLTFDARIAWAGRLAEQLDEPCPELDLELGWLLYYGGEPEKALSLRDRSRNQTGQSPTTVVRGAWLDARLLANLGRMAEAIEGAESARIQAEDEGLDGLYFGLSSMLVELYIEQARLADAMQVGRTLLSWIEDDRMASLYHGSTALVRIAPLYLMEGEIDTARRLFTWAVDLLEQKPNKVQLGGALVNRAMFEAYIGDVAAARRTLQRIEEKHPSNNHLTPVQIQVVWCLVSDAEGQEAEAQRHSEQCIALARAGGLQRSLVAALSYQARLDLFAGRNGSDALTEARALCAGGAHRLLERMLLGIQAWQDARASRATALEHAQQAVDGLDNAESADELVLTLAGATMGFAAAGDTDAAAHWYDVLEKLVQKLSFLANVPPVLKLLQQDLAHHGLSFER